MPYFTSSDQIQIYFKEENPSGGIPIIFLHGLGANGDSWEMQSQYFAEQGYRTISPDTRGFGRSGFRDHSALIKQMAGDVAELMAFLNIAQATIVGISMGGVIALQFAVAYPNLVHGLVLTNTFAALRPTSPSTWLYFLQRMFLVHTIGIDKQADIVAKRIFPDPDQAWLQIELKKQILQANQQAYRASMRSLALFDIRGQLPGINTPTLVISGSLDTTVPMSHQVELVKNISTCDHLIIEGGGHAVSVQYPNLYSAALEHFLTDKLIVPDR
jgi:pimeloyl-ACP methyl ester carboxylesterase